MIFGSKSERFANWRKKRLQILLMKKWSSFKFDCCWPAKCFHSLRHTSTTYKLKLSGGDIKAVQGDTGHAQATMVTERYAHILDDDRRVNAVRFQKEFYGGGSAAEPEVAAAASSPEGTQQAPVGDPLQNLDATAKQQLLLKLLAESPEMSALLTVLSGKSA